MRSTWKRLRTFPGQNVSPSRRSANVSTSRRRQNVSTWRPSQKRFHVASQRKHFHVPLCHKTFPRAGKRFANVSASRYVETFLEKTFPCARKRFFWRRFHVSTFGAHCPKTLPKRFGVAARKRRMTFPRVDFLAAKDFGRGRRGNVYRGNVFSGRAGIAKNVSALDVETF